jgi:hypothetical protein
VGVSELVFGPAIFFAKLSIFLLYLRLFGPNKWTKYLTYIGIAMTFAVYTATTFAFGYLCVRRPGETWYESQTSDRCLVNSIPLYYIQGIFGLLSDLYIFFLPVPVVWRLQMPLKRRIGVMAIFATGILSVPDPRYLVQATDHHTERLWRVYWACIYDTKLPWEQMSSGPYPQPFSSRQCPSNVV